jgi:hypothetical protein
MALNRERLQEIWHESTGLPEEDGSGIVSSLLDNAGEVKGMRVELQEITRVEGWFGEIVNNIDVFKDAVLDALLRQ